MDIINSRVIEKSIVVHLLNLTTLTGVLTVTYLFSWLFENVLRTMDSLKCLMRDK